MSCFFYFYWLLVDNQFRHDLSRNVTEIDVSITFFQCDTRVKHIKFIPVWIVSPKRAISLLRCVIYQRIQILLYYQYFATGSPVEAKAFINNHQLIFVFDQDNSFMDFLYQSIFRPHRRRVPVSLYRYFSFTWKFYSRCTFLPYSFLRIE